MTTKIEGLIQKFQPQWKSIHKPHCRVVSERESLWMQFVNDPANAPSALIGALAEYDNEGDQEIDNCTCGKFSVQEKSLLESYNPRENLEQATVLSAQARALALHIEAFNDLVARDTNTHDGEERGEHWSEGKPYVGGDKLKDIAARLRDLADLWDFG